MARVLLVSLVFPPDGVSTAHLLGELAAGLRDHGHEVQVLTTSPHYNVDSDARAAQPLRRRLLGLYSDSTFQGMDVVHIPMPLKDSRVWKRLLSWIWFHAATLVYALLRIGRVQVVLTSSPPLTLGLVCWLIARVKGAKLVYNVQELYPDCAIRLGALRNPAMIRLLYGCERLVYRAADAVTVIGPGMETEVLRKGAKTAKVHLIPNFVDENEIRPTAKDNGFSREFGLKDKFVVCYAGNMGRPQGLDVVVASALLLRDLRDVRFVLVGDGTDKARLHAKAAAQGSENVLILDHQPYARVPEIYGAADVCVVPLHAALLHEALPSKVVRIMAAGRPILALSEPQSDLAQVVSSAGCGRVIASPTPTKVADAVREMWLNRDLTEAMGLRGRTYASAHFSRTRVTGQYATLIRSLLNGAGEGIATA